MNLDHDFVQVSKLSEDQKKKVLTKKGTLFPPEFKWIHTLRCIPESNYWGGCRCTPYSAQSTGGIQPNYWWGYIPLRVLAPLLAMKGY